MSYLVLARKYRPKTFGDVVGQEVVTATLRGAMQEGRVGHAYLFTGPRGTGKTTTARILAKGLICERGPTADPCGVCERCSAADSGAEVDIVEIDAASNTGVDSVRELRDQAAFLPLRARYKIYIIDEVHMLSKPAFNALLKTLEEPPAHVKFLLATTDLHKVLETVVSRCQVLRLLPLPERVIEERLEEIFRRESIRAGAGVCAELARRARGGMRDALSLADQLLALAGEAPTLEDLRSLASEAAGDAFERVLDALEARDVARVLACLPVSQGAESEWLAMLLGALRANLLIGLCGESFPLVELAPAERTRALARAQRVGTERLTIWLEELLVARERMHPLPQHARALLEVALIDLCRPEQTLTQEELLRRLEALEARLNQAPSASRSAALHSPTSGLSTAPPSAAAPSPLNSPTAAVVRAPLGPSASAMVGASPAAPAVQLLDPKTFWPRFLEELQQSSPSLSSALRTRARVGELSPSGLRIQIANFTPEERAMLEAPRGQKLLQTAASKLAGRELAVRIDEAGQAPVRKAQDSFASEVSQLFGGRIEEDR